MNESMAIYSQGAAQGLLQPQGAARESAFDGLAVSLSDDKDALVQDSCEELTFSKDNSRKTKLADRKTRGAGSRIERIRELYELYTRTLRGDSTGRAAGFASRARNMTAAQAYSQALSEFGSQGGFAALAYARDELKSRDPKASAIFEKAANLMYEGHRGEIDSGANVMREALHDAPASSSVFKSLRDYSDALLNFKNGGDMLAFVQERFKDDTDAGIGFLISALGADLGSDAPGADSALLESAASAMVKVRVINSSLRGMDALLSRLSKAGGQDISGTSATKVLQKLLRLDQERYISPSDVRSLLSEVRTKDPEQEVLLCQDLAAALRSLPDEAYGTLAVRGAVADAAQKLIDSCIAKEDEWLATKH